MSLRDAATNVRLNAYAPYSGFLVGAAVRTPNGKIFAGCNVENAAYPEGTCAEAGAIAAMVAAGETQIVEAFVIGDSPTPLTPCGGCRQKLAEFGKPDMKITMSTMGGETMVRSIADMLPGAFGPEDMKET